ncbi:MAG TPA: hypothetical protein VGM46_13560 [Mesorhizobium sp.]
MLSKHDRYSHITRTRLPVRVAASQASGGVEPDGAAAGAARRFADRTLGLPGDCGCGGTGKVSGGGGMAIDGSAGARI